MSVRAAPNPDIQRALAQAEAEPANAIDVSAANPDDLGEGATGFQSKSIDHPLKRNVVVGVRASLADLTTNAGRGAWTPSMDTIRAIYQQKQYLDLGGQAQAEGDLKSVVVHSIEAKGVTSTFPIAVGARITGVDEKFFSSIGASFSMVALPNQKSTSATVLQEEDPSVAYDFAKRYPGYTADNLESNGIHAVPQRRFVLVAASHPLVTAIQENSSSLQTSDITQMPEQLIKISSSLYDTLMPLVRQQVKSQIKVLDLSSMNVAIAPADYANWSSAAEAMSREAVAPLKAEQKRALKRATGDPDKIASINAEYEEKIEAEQAAVANTPLEFYLELQTTYNFL